MRNTRDSAAGSVLLAMTLASSAGASVVVVPVPQATGTTQYLRASLSASGGIAAFSANNASGRLIRWTESTGALVECASPGPFSISYSIKVTDIGTTTGGWHQAAAPSLRGGALWLSGGSLSIGPFGGSGAYGEAVAGSTNGYPYFITDFEQGVMYQLNSAGAPISRGRPAGTTAVFPRDASRDGGACVLAASSATATHAYRWTLAGGFRQVPLLAGATATSPVAISDDGLRVIGVSTADSGQQGFVWSVDSGADSGLVSMGMPPGASIGNLAASGDGSLACGQYTVRGVTTHFVWSADAGLMTASAFAASRCLAAGAPVEFLDFNSDGTVAVARIGAQTVLLKGLGCTAGDFDRDGDVDAADLATLLANWGSRGDTDLDADGTTAGSDLAVILANWT